MAREEARLTTEGPSLDSWLTAVEEFRIPDLSREWIVTTMRELREGDRPGRSEE
ncbi:hypothetical protein B0I33_108307 [Prauserella shujinwangii]|uniref:Uncharacterized protein n=1 Tax=Prauserella shujinwangii TaxID=1453103 RepID=A0A2T0LRM9_9PSEU|nr:hypothetical protein [Prauserella shujinwangii]PRX46160.1 hypothetical protein B0I33_108307 [Prauserella shujinwangii]